MTVDLIGHILTGLILGWVWHQYWPVWGLTIGIVLGFVSGVYHIWKKHASH